MHIHLKKKPCSWICHHTKNLHIEDCYCGFFNWGWVGWWYNVVEIYSSQNNSYTCTYGFLILERKQYVIQKRITWCHLTWLYHGHFWDALCGLTVFLDVEVPLHLQLVALAPCHGTAGTLSDWVIQVVSRPLMRKPLQLLWHILHLLKHHSQISVTEIRKKYQSDICQIYQ